MKKCPYCAEEIQEEAIKCRFCAEHLRKKRWYKSCLLGCLTALVAWVGLIFLFLFLVSFLFKFTLFKIFFSMPHLPRYYYPPSTGMGLENMLRDFREFFRIFWDKLIELFQRRSVSF